MARGTRIEAPDLYQPGCFACPVRKNAVAHIVREKPPSGRLIRYQSVATACRVNEAKTGIEMHNRFVMIVQLTPRPTSRLTVEGGDRYWRPVDCPEYDHSATHQGADDIIEA